MNHFLRTNRLKKIFSKERKRLQKKNQSGPTSNKEETCIEAGVDEVGRGPLAGPVTAAAVILNPDIKIEGLKDSKALSKKKREELEPIIKENAVSWNVTSLVREEIDRTNILKASLKCMQEAVEGLDITPEKILVDGKNPLETDIPCEAIINGDKKVQSIMAASILAKVNRDRYMESLKDRYPGYGFEKNKGYGTEVHLLALDLLGPCKEHRITFSPVKKVIEAGTYKYREEAKIRSTVRDLLSTKNDEEIIAWLENLKKNLTRKKFKQIRNILREEWKFIKQASKFR